MPDAFDLTRLRFGELVTAGSAAGLLIVLFVDWFGAGELEGASGWESLEILRFLLLILIAMAFGVVALTVLARPVAMPVAAAVITLGVAVLCLLCVLFRVAINEPGPNEFVSVELGAYLGIAFTAGIVVGLWRTLQDERTESGASKRQAERVLSVRGAARPAPPERDPERGRKSDPDASAAPPPS